MPIKKSEGLDKLRARVKTYRAKIPGTEIIPGEPIGAVVAPIQTGMSRFISVDDMPEDINDLPFIKERERDFAFRYATEYRTHKQWAEVYNVSLPTIQRWLNDPAIRTYIALCRYEQRMYNVAQMSIVQRNMFDAMNRILKVNLTNDNIASVGTMVRFVFDILNSTGGRPRGNAPGEMADVQGIPDDPSQQEEGPYNLPGNPYASKLPKNVTPQQIEDLRTEIEELDILARAVHTDDRTT
jgi:hypothetical protein